MSSIYIQEPPTDGKVCLKTTVGDIDIELWSKECPKACRNFVQLCVNGYYDGTIFHRVVPGFIVQGGDPTATGMGGESIYGEPFKDEFHSRLRFNRRGLVAMANGGPNDNGSQFFFTLGPAEDLQNKHTIFGKCAGDTVYNMLKMGECQTDKNERPENPHKIIKTEILKNPFPDVVPQLPSKKRSLASDERPSKPAVKAEKNLTLLSFGDEEEDEDATASNFISKKIKSAHDVLDHTSKLSAEPAVKDGETNAQSDSESDTEEMEHKELIKNRIREKFKNFGSRFGEELTDNTKANEQAEDEDLNQLLDQEESMGTKAKVEAMKAEARKLQKEIVKSSRQERDKQNPDPVKEETPESAGHAVLMAEREKYQVRGKKQKGTTADDPAFAKMEQFRIKLQQMHEAADQSKSNNISSVDQEKEDESAETSTMYLDEEDVADDDWWSTQLVSDEKKLPQAKDANVMTDDTYDIYDPRNPMNKRRRERKHEKHDRREKHHHRSDRR